MMNPKMAIMQAGLEAILEAGRTSEHPRARYCADIARTSLRDALEKPDPVDDISEVLRQGRMMREACEQFLALWPGIHDGSRPAHPDVRMAVNKARAALAATAAPQDTEARHE